MYLGSVGRANGLSAIVEGFLSAAAAEPSLRLEIIGTGAELPAIRQRAAESVHGHRIMFEPPVPRTGFPSWSVGPTRWSSTSSTSMSTDSG